MNEELEKIIKDYIYDNRKEGFKVNKQKNTLTIYGNVSVALWIFGFLFLAWGVATMLAGVKLGIILIAVAIFGFFMPVTKRTVFDIGKGEIRQDTFFITTSKIKASKVVNYHTTIVKVNGMIKSYVFDLEYLSEFGTKKNIMKGIAGFKDYQKLMDFEPVVTKILSEMR